MQISLHDIEGQMLRVGIRRGEKAAPPLLLFNGIGANIELVEPFLDALDGLEAIIFDVPGVGGSPPPWLPYRPSSLARLSAQLLDQLGHAQVDVLGLSWGGALAQQFAFQQGKRCRRLVLAATSPGHLMVPAKLTVLLKMATPRRYKDSKYMERIAGDIYGGALRGSPELVHSYLRHVRWSSDYGYYLQLLAGCGWTSLPWLRWLAQGGNRRSARAVRQWPHPGKSHPARAAGDHRRRPSVSGHQCQRIRSNDFRIPELTQRLLRTRNSFPELLSDSPKI
jgi:poly(3-hydroxyalkanoate) depolymerase